MFKDVEEVNLFVPGRICLIGESSDWNFEYISQNKNIVPGSAITTGIDKGIYATVRKSNNLKFTMDDYYFECELDENQLKKESESFSFYSYIAGVVLHMYRKYHVSGVNIIVKKQTLPIKKGLASSAAICVLIVKAYNLLYNLNISFHEQIQDAYEGEQLALSNCGKLDQVCVLGEHLNHLMFYPDCVSINQVLVKKPMHMVIVDLMSKKDTRTILNALRECYPVPNNRKEEAFHQFLNEDNPYFVKSMVSAIEEGDIVRVGHIMKEYQRQLDKVTIPLCDELKAPVLHKTMNNEIVQKLSYGSRSIGSGGDGSLQILAKDKESQEELIDYLNTELKMDAFGYTIKSSHLIKKAIIPLAGFGTRLYPLTRGIKKSFIPVNDGETMKPLILKLVEDLDKAGIAEIALIIQPEDYEQYYHFFKKSLSDEHMAKLSEENQEYELNILRLGEKIHFVFQNEQMGFGHAVLLAREFTQKEPALMILGDTYYETDDKYSCIEQMLNCYDEVKANIVGLGEIEDDEIKNVAISKGIWNNEAKTMMSIKEMVEKPTNEYAKENLSMDNKYYGNFGMWVMDDSVFAQLQYNVQNHILSKGEYQFVDAIAQLIDKKEIKGLKLNGISYDVGNITTYRKTLLRTLRENNINKDL